MTGPAIQIHERDTDLRGWDSAAKGEVKFRTLIDAAGGPSSALVQGIAEFPPAGTEAMHRHDRPETAFVLSGGGALLLRGEERAVEPGDMLFVPAGLSHGWRAGEEGLRLLWSFPGDRLDEVSYDWEGA
jgi:quercetin dioxygenase-like cupin family protein